MRQLCKCKFHASLLWANERRVSATCGSLSSCAYAACDSTCSTCDGANLDQCLTCPAGRYASSTANFFGALSQETRCLPCLLDSQCMSWQYCNVQRQGLTNYAAASSCSTCDASCKSCTQTATQCTACASGYGAKGEMSLALPCRLRMAVPTHLHAIHLHLSHCEAISEDAAQGTAGILSAFNTLSCRFCLHRNLLEHRRRHFAGN